jgi:hypothetical protein
MGWTREETIRYCRANAAKTDREIENEIDRYITSPGKLADLQLADLVRGDAAATAGPAREEHPEELVGKAALPRASADCGTIAARCSVPGDAACYAI